jgi:replicative DNA helicase
MPQNENKLKNNPLKVPPQSNESEMAVLGSIMLKPDVMNEVLDIITKECFYSTRHRMIFENLLELFADGKPIDLLSVSEKLKTKDLLNKVGGSSYLTELIESVPSSANILYYSEIVKNKHALRSLIEAAEHISALGYNATDEIDVVLDEAEKKVFNVTNKNDKRTLIEAKEILGDAWERIDHLHKNKDELRGVSSGFKALDNILAGFQKSDLIILAARPSVGKTSLALDIMRHVTVREKVPAAIFSLEMSSQQLIDRMLAAEAQVNAWKLRTGNLTNEEDFGRIRDTLSVLSEAPIYVDDKPANNIISMRSTARKLKSEKGLGLIIVDYLQLMMPTSSKNSDNVVQQVTEISRSLKSLARELDVPVIALSQLSRAVEQRGGKPRLSDLRDSGSIEQDADVVMFIHREDRYKEEDEKTNIAEILVEKHRNGPTGVAKLYFDDTKSTFNDVDTSEYGNDAVESF